MKTQALHWNSLGRMLLVVVTVCSLSACASTSRQAATSSVAPPDLEIESSTSRKAAGTASVSSGPIVPPPVSPSYIQQTSARQSATEQSGQPVSHLNASAISFSPAEPRTNSQNVHQSGTPLPYGCPPMMSPSQAPGCPPYAPHACGPYPNCQITGSMCEVCLPQFFPDEYICDGGDRGLPFHYENNEYAGLESEDTIAEYTHHTGEQDVKISNRVCIYSPRFAAVTTVSTPTEGTGAQFASGTDKTINLFDVNGQLGTTWHNEYASAGGVRMRSRASGLEGDNDPDTLNQTTVAGRNDKLQNVFENLLFLRTGRFEQTEMALIGEYIDAAQTWTRNLSPIITAHSAAGNQLKATALPMEIVGLEDRRKQGDLQLVKMADKKVALAGDVITFTLRYDNLGDFEMNHIRIVDNLTPRLEYIEGSVDFGDRAGELLTFDNNEGSLILQFKLKDELPGKTGGVITFQTRVRPTTNAAE